MRKIESQLREQNDQLAQQKQQLKIAKTAHEFRISASQEKLKDLNQKIVQLTQEKEVLLTKQKNLENDVLLLTAESSVNKPLLDLIAKVHKIFAVAQPQSTLFQSQVASKPRQLISPSATLK